MRKNKTQEKEIVRLNKALKDSELLNHKLIKEISNKTNEIEKLINEKKNQSQELLNSFYSEGKKDSAIKKFISKAKVEILREFDDLRKKWKEQFNCNDYDVKISIIDKNVDKILKPLEEERKETEKNIEKYLLLNLV